MRQKKATTLTRTEHQEQSAFFEEAALRTNKDYRWGLLFAIPNGGFRHIATARKLKREGVKAGVPDVFLPYAAKNSAGLFLEFKTKKGKTSENQDGWIEALRREGYAVVVVRSAEEAVFCVAGYLRAGLTR